MNKEHYKPFPTLVQRIKQDGKCLPGGILKVDSFINHQIDPTLLQSIAIEFVRRFASKQITKILTIEASGIAPAIMVGFLLNVPVVFAKKKIPSTMDDMYTAKVFSFTKNKEYLVCCAKDYLHHEDQVLFIDDFLANGNAAKGIIEIVRQAGAHLVGMGFIVEKSFQKGGQVLRELGMSVESLAIIDSLDDCQIQIRE